MTKCLLHPGSIAGLQKFLLASELLHHGARTPALRALPWREFHHGLHVLGDERARGGQHEDTIRPPLTVVDGADLRILVGVGPQVNKHREPQLYDWLLPRRQSLGALHSEMDFPVAVAERHQVALVAPVEETGARILLRLALQKREEIESVDIDLEGLIARFVALFEFRRDVRLPGRGD